MEFFFFFDLVGIFAFTISGYLIGVRKNLDLLGILIAAFSTALGGGILRDVIADRVPFAFAQSYPFITVLCSLLFAYILRIDKKVSVDKRSIFVISDSIGLVAFGITGALVGIETGFNIFGTILLGFLTAVGGGIMRDVLINEIPMVLVSEVYGVVAIFAAVACYVLSSFEFLNTLSLFLVFGVSLFIRILAFKRGWQLPKIR